MAPYGSKWFTPNRVLMEFYDCFHYVHICGLHIMVSGVRSQLVIPNE